MFWSKGFRSMLILFLFQLCFFWSWQIISISSSGNAEPLLSVLGCCAARLTNFLEAGGTEFYPNEQGSLSYLLGEWRHVTTVWLTHQEPAHSWPNILTGPGSPSREIRMAQLLPVPEAHIFSNVRLTTKMTSEAHLRVFCRGSSDPPARREGWWYEAQRFQELNTRKVLYIQVNCQ